VEIMQAYLNPAERVKELRTTLMRLTSPGAPVDEPDLGALERRDDQA
jgi:hypothetical protein